MKISKLLISFRPPGRMKVKITCKPTVIGLQVSRKTGVLNNLCHLKHLKV
jgi:hypothetical protein